MSPYPERVVQLIGGPHDGTEHLLLNPLDFDSEPSAIMMMPLESELVDHDSKPSDLAPRYDRYIRCTGGRYIHDGDARCDRGG